MIGLIKDWYKKNKDKNPAIATFVLRFKNQIYFDTTKKKVKGAKNRIFTNYSLLKNVTFDVSGDGNTIKIDYHSFLRNTVIYIRGSGNVIEIGKDCRINNSAVLWIEGNNSKLSLGKKTTIEEAHIAVTEDDSSISLGEDCMLANGIVIRNGDSHSILDKNTGSRINYAKSVVVGNHVWIATNCTILKGVSVANNVVIGSNTVLTKDVNDSWVVVAGNPSVVVKRDVDWCRERLS